jgi:hypothetical protein
MDWMHAVADLPLPLTLACVIALSLLVPVIAVSIVRRLRIHAILEESRELVGFTYSVFGLIYGVLLAYTIVVAWERFAETERIVMRETTVLSELWRDSQAFAPDIREALIHQELIDYARSVVQDEWPMMAAQGTAHPRTVRIYERLWGLSYQLTPVTKNQELFLQEFLARMNELSSTRRLRVLYSRAEIHPILWMVLLLGSVMTFVYTLLFYNKNRWLQLLITTFMMLIVMLGLLVIVSLQYPFTGDVSVRPEAFNQLLYDFHLRTVVPRIAGGG